jgi:hypothetical protein
LAILPKRLKWLQTHSCPNLNNLDGSPEELESFVVYNCPIARFSGVPATLKSLEIINCNNLYSLDGLPEGYTGKISLRNTPLAQILGRRVINFSDLSMHARVELFLELQG